MNLYPFPSVSISKEDFQQAYDVYFFPNHPQEKINVLWKDFFRLFECTSFFFSGADKDPDTRFSFDLFIPSTGIGFKVYCQPKGRFLEHLQIEENEHTVHPPPFSKWGISSSAFLIYLYDCLAPAEKITFAKLGIFDESASEILYDFISFSCEVPKKLAFCSAIRPISVHFSPLKSAFSTGQGYFKLNATLSILGDIFTFETEVYDHELRHINYEGKSRSLADAIYQQLPFDLQIELLGLAERHFDNAMTNQYLVYLLANFAVTDKTHRIRYQFDSFTRDKIDLVLNYPSYNLFFSKSFHQLSVFDQHYF